MSTTYQKNYPSSPPPDPLEANILQIEETNQLLSNLESKISNMVGRNASPPFRHSNDIDPTAYRNPPIPYRAEPRMPYNAGISPQNFKGARRSLGTGYDSGSKPGKRHINIVGDSNEEQARIMSSHLYSSPERVSSLYGASPIKNEDFHEIHRPDFKNSFKLRDEESHHNDRSGYAREPIETFGSVGKDGGLERVREGIRQRNAKKQGDNLLEKMGQMEKFYKQKVDILEEKIVVYEDEVRTNARLVDELRSEVEELKRALGEGKKREQRYEDETVKWTGREHEWGREKKGIERELEQVKKMYKETMLEKEELEKRCEGLLRVQREMVQLDMERNEKNLKSSAIKMEEKAAVENERITGLMDTVEQYKEEVEYLKENNNLIRKQLGFEVEQLREQLEEQKRENRRLARRARNESISSPSGEYREGKGKESGNYVKEWGNYYPEEDDRMGKAGHSRGKSSVSRKNEEGVRRYEERERDEGEYGSYETRGTLRRERK